MSEIQYQDINEILSQLDPDDIADWLEERGYDIFKFPEPESEPIAYRRKPFYVNSDTGDDSNDGLSWGKAVKTLGRAIEISDKWKESIDPNSGWNWKAEIMVMGDSKTPI